MRIPKLRISGASAALAAGLLAAFAAPSAAAIRSGDWTGDFSIPAFDGQVRSAAILGGKYYVAGDFHWAGSVPVKNVARWTGEAWTSVGGGLPLAVNRLAVRGTELLAATSSGFPGSSPVMRFQGAWNALGSTLSGEATALLVDGSDLYVAGYLGTPNVANEFRVMRWDGLDWQPVGAAFDANIRALATYQGELYAGGEFQTAEGQPVSHIARWDGTQWQSVGGGTDDGYGAYVNALAVYGGRLIAGGFFTGLGGLPIHGIGAWNGATWDSLPETPRTAFIYDLETEGSELQVTGVLQVPNEWDSGLVTFDGQHWRLPDPHPSSSIMDVASGDGVMIAVGNSSGLYSALSNTLNGPMRNVIVRDPTWRQLFAWKPTMRGLLGPSWTQVSTLYADHGELYAGGYFEYAPVAQSWDFAGSLVRWTGDDWTPVGKLLGWVNRITRFAGRIVAGGSGFYSGTGTYTTVVSWDGSSWGDLGGQLFGGVAALTEWQGALVAAGNVYLSGQSTMSGVAVHRSRGWEILGNLPITDYQSTVLDVATFGGELYAAGSGLNLAGDRHGLLRWSGTQWTSIPGAPDGPALCLLSRADGLWVGFSSLFGMGGAIWRWDGAQWTAMGDLAGIPVALAEAGGEVIAAGGLYTDREPVSLARWTGTEWLAIPGGPRDYIRSLAAVGNDLYVGGAFEQTQLQQSEGLARWSFVPEVVLPSIPSIGTWPSPVRDRITFHLSATSAARAVVEIYDLHGARIATPVDETIPAGDTERSWAIPTSRMPAGVYFARVRIGDTRWSRRIVLVR